MKTRILNIFFASVLILSQSCSKDDDGPTVTAPNVLFSNTQITATFFQAGSSEVPTIDWNGEQGSVAIIPEIEGLTVDDQTGQLIWTNMLAPRQYSFQLVATNSAGLSTTDITIDNYLEGEFVGDYSYNGNTVDFYYNITFYPNGSMSIKDDSGSVLAVGEWVFLPSGNLLTNYTYANGDEFSTFGDLFHTVNNVTYSGTWHNGFNAIQANEAGTFSVVMD